MSVVPVNLGDRSYQIEIGKQLLPEIGKRLSAYPVGNQVVVVTDETVDRLYGNTVITSLEQQGFIVEKVAIKPGESSKSWDNAERILELLLRNKVNRDGTIVALGGGVVGDLAGFVASVYQRGINFIQIPTTLLAQVDSSVGGKVAVNHQLGKNMIGSFYQPLAVWIDTDTLSTLPKRQWSAGLGEVVKYGVIYSEEFFQFLQQNKVAIMKQEDRFVEQIIAKCCGIKAEIVSEDEEDRGIRAILNYGHTIGHGLEQATNYEGFLHGEAVAVGMVLAYGLAKQIGFAEDDQEAALVELLQGFALPTEYPKDIANEEVLDAMLIDKKIEKGQLVFIFPKVLGQAEVVKGIPMEQVREFLRKMEE